MIFLFGQSETGKPHTHAIDSIGTLRTVADVHASVVAMGGRVSALEVELKEKDEMLARVLEEVKELRSKLQQQN